MRSSVDAPRTTPAAVLAAGLAALIAWALRDHAEYLPSGGVAPRLAPAPGHGHGGGEVYQSPPPVAGEALANYMGLAMVALHVMLVAVVLVACGIRRWSCRPGRRSPGLLARVAFAGAVAVVAASTTLAMAVVLLGAGISFPALLAAAVTVLRYAFVFVIVSSAVLGMP